MRLSSALIIVLCCLALLAVAPPARAQDCSECSPCSSLCTDTCMVCTREGIDGCIAWRESTCGDEGQCIGRGCCPNYVQTGYDAVGTYGEGHPVYCIHHTVYKVTLTDTNNCETPNIYQYCDNVPDGYKAGFYPDCCDGYGPYGTLDPLYTCNHWHSCF